MNQQHDMSTPWQPDSAGQRHCPVPAAPPPLLRLVAPTPALERMQPERGPAAHDAAAAAAVTDRLTGSYSRRECRQMLAHMFVRASRFRSPLALIVVQVEQFEQIARLFGGAVADAVLVELAAFLSGLVRGGDVVARWDDAAFALLLPGMAAGEAKQLAARLQAAIGPAFLAGFGHLSCGIGLASSCQHASAAALASAASALAAPGAQRRFA
ncbi:MAG TPA: GGDEF domain-containing protein [Burkholderiaceae bacterium]|nr:GGDEF domain-containing protein [Burkholderiaceae bacterium]